MSSGSFSLKEVSQQSSYLENHYPPTFIFNQEGICISALGISDAHQIDIECFLGDSLSDILPAPLANRLFVQLTKTIDSGVPQRDEVLLPVRDSDTPQWFLSEFLPLSSSPYQPITVMWKLTDIDSYIREHEALLDSRYVSPEHAISNEAFLVTELCEELKIMKRHDTKLALTYIELVKDKGSIHNRQSNSPLELGQQITNHIESLQRSGQTLCQLGTHRYVLLQPGVEELKAKLVSELIFEELNQLLQDEGLRVRYGVLSVSRQRLGPIKIDQFLALQLIEEAASRA